MDNILRGHESLTGGCTACSFRSDIRYVTDSEEAICCELRNLEILVDIDQSGTASVFDVNKGYRICFTRGASTDNLTYLSKLLLLALENLPHIQRRAPRQCST